MMIFSMALGCADEAGAFSMSDGDESDTSDSRSEGQVDAG